MRGDFFSYQSSKHSVSFIKYYLKTRKYFFFIEFRDKEKKIERKKENIQQKKGASNQMQYIIRDKK